MKGVEHLFLVHWPIFTCSCGLLFSYNLSLNSMVHRSYAGHKIEMHLLIISGPFNIHSNCINLYMHCFLRQLIQFIYRYTCMYICKYLTDISMAALTFSNSFFLIVTALDIVFRFSSLLLNSLHLSSYALFN